MSDTLSIEQSKAVVLLLEGSDVKSVSLQLGKNRSTIDRWCKLPEFAAKLSEGRSIGYQDASNRLSKSSYLAACELESIMSDSDNKPEIRLKAATEIIGIGLRLSEHIDLISRVAALELLVEQNNEA